MVKMETDTPPVRKNRKLIWPMETGGWTRLSRFLPHAREGGGQDGKKTGEIRQN